MEHAAILKMRMREAKCKRQQFLSLVKIPNTVRLKNKFYTYF